MARAESNSTWKGASYLEGWHLSLASCPHSCPRCSSVTAMPRASSVRRSVSGSSTKEKEIVHVGPRHSRPVSRLAICPHRTPLPNRSTPSVETGGKQPLAQVRVQPNTVHGLQHFVGAVGEQGLCLFPACRLA